MRTNSIRNVVTLVATYINTLRISLYTYIGGGGGYIWSCILTNKLKYNNNIGFIELLYHSDTWHYFAPDVYQS